MISVTEVLTLVPLDPTIPLFHESFMFSQLPLFQWDDSALVFAQNLSEIKSIDIMADFQKAFTNFIESGQVWALGIGLVLGWVLHGFVGS